MFQISCYFFIDAFDGLKDKFIPFVSSICRPITYLLLYLRWKFHNNMLSHCQDIAILLLGYFNLAHPLYRQKVEFLRYDNKYNVCVSPRLFCLKLKASTYTRPTSLRQTTHPSINRARCRVTLSIYM